MGIKGSSTRQLVLDDVAIPADHLLGEVGKGHIVALNVLNVGRLKLGVACLGACRVLLETSLGYAAERKQFGKSIDNFQLIQEKLADMALDIYALESMAYRCAGSIDELVSRIEVGADDLRYGDRKVGCIEEYLVEASVLKVYGSEALSRVVDEAVQIHGGYGFIEEYAVCGAYRDARINRIFEGTNEINRMLMPGTILKRALHGRIDLQGPVMKLLAEIKDDRIRSEPADGDLGREATAIDLLRNWATFGYGVAAQRAMGEPNYLQGSQVVLRQLADLTMTVYAAESCYLRTRKRLSGDWGSNGAVPTILTEVIVYEKLRHARDLVWQICANVAAGDERFFAANRKAMCRLSNDYALDTLTLKARIARHLIERGRYALT